MPLTRQPRTGLPTPLLGALCGTALGLTTFLAVAFLYRLGATHAAGLTAEYALLLSLVCLAATVLLGQPAKRRRARVPINRVVPHQWWPREAESVPMLVACIGGPLIAGAGAAVLFFR
jgi:hypothetical protein